MSACDHQIDGDFVCQRCDALDEDGLIADRDRYKAAVDAVNAMKFRPKQVSDPVFYGWNTAVDAAQRLIAETLA